MDLEGHSGRGASILIHLRQRVTTTLKVRAAIQASDAPASVLAERFGTTEHPQTNGMVERFNGRIDEVLW